MRLPLLVTAAEYKAVEDVVIESQSAKGAFEGRIGGPQLVRTRKINRKRKNSRKDRMRRTARTPITAFSISGIGELSAP